MSLMSLNRQEGEVLSGQHKHLKELPLALPSLAAAWVKSAFSLLISQLTAGLGQTKYPS